jgi:hypothetical protein
MPRISLATVPICFNFHLFAFPRCQGSSVVEQGTHKPLVGSSTLPPGTQSTTSISELVPKEQATPDPVLPGVTESGANFAPGRCVYCSRSPTTPSLRRGRTTEGLVVRTQGAP